MATLLVNAAGERVHVAETGRAGAPSVLVTSGLGGAWFDWRAVVDELRDRFRVTVVDRPGLGLSRPARRPPTLDRDADVLEALAERAGRPVTLVAHSMGAFSAEAAARRRPDLVAGVVLVDPSYEDERPGPAWRLAARAIPLTRPLGAALAATGLPLLGAPAARRAALWPVARRIPRVPASIVRSVYARPAVLGTFAAEWLAYAPMAADLLDLRARTDFPPVPLVVLTAASGEDPADERTWARRHAELAAMSPRGVRVELADSRHMVMFDRPDAVAAAVREAAG
ncbi:Sigma factor SigB regulation protein RsbQ [Actinomadura rubteroloni]|uniref:Sigma factor SigB regulation protein RsbQ n=1 Tax=Actinomadura rubteroloni TaxID=1926885 RepID=A0A2P4UKT3_9ACTN|nr:alpha/beta fold hydrolase [Actinomadura rubteroloni]POM25599.1 Sigma factor SigB regulation protein RsbQ [Actinomadura rubteroloni]